MSDLLTERERLVINSRENGNTWQAIGETIHVSRERARQIYVKAKRKQNGEYVKPEKSFLVPRRKPHGPRSDRS